MITITCLANASLLLTDSETTLLIDGLYQSTGHSFDPLPGDIEQQLLNGTLKIAETPTKVAHLLFTHQHSDHFSAAKTVQFVRQNPVKSLWLPADLSGGRQQLAAQLPAHHGTVYWSTGTAGSVERQQIEPQLSVTAIGSAHIGGEAFAEDTHTSFLLVWHGRRLLVTADAHPDRLVFEAVLGHDPLDAVFVNPMFYQNPEGNRLIHQLFKPEQLFVYHIPAPENDHLGLRASTQLLLKKHQDMPYHSQAFMQPLTTVTIK